MSPKRNEPAAGHGRLGENNENQRSSGFSYMVTNAGLVVNARQLTAWQREAISRQRFSEIEMLAREARHSIDERVHALASQLIASRCPTADARRRG